MKNVKHNLKSLLLSVLYHGHNKSMCLFEDAISFQVLKSDSVTFCVVVNDALEKLKCLPVQKVVVYLVELS